MSPATRPQPSAEHHLLAEPPRSSQPPTLAEPPLSGPALTNNGVRTEPQQPAGGFSLDPADGGTTTPQRSRPEELCVTRPVANC